MFQAQKLTLIVPFFVGRLAQFAAIRLDKIDWRFHSTPFEFADPQEMGDIARLNVWLAEAETKFGPSENFCTWNNRGLARLPWSRSLEKDWIDLGSVATGLSAHRDMGSVVVPQNSKPIFQSYIDEHARCAERLLILCETA